MPVIKKSGFLHKLIIASVCWFLVATSAQATPTSEGIQIYQKNLTQLPENKQKLADDISRYRNADNLWDVLRDEFSLPHYEDSPIVQDKIEWYMNNQDYLLRACTRAAPYLYYISQQVRNRHLPAELVLLPIIESGYNPFSLSRVGAAGVWQLMPDTATGLGIHQDSWYDGRRDVIASTRGALNYLAYLQSFFEGNWLLAIAAYNTGEGNVLNAIRRNIRAGKSTDFWSLPLARETKVYVPMLLALAVIISHPDRYPIYFPPVRNAPYLGQVDVGSQISLKYAATLAGISYQKMIQLNPGFYRYSLAKRGPYKLVLPIENVEQFSTNLMHSALNRPPSWKHYRVKSGDTLASISSKFKTSISSIRRMNHLAEKNNTLRTGTNLLIPAKHLAETAPISRHTVANQNKKSTASKLQMALAPRRTNYKLLPGDTIYMVRSNDNASAVAKRFHVKVSDIESANGLSAAQITTGKQIIIPTHIIADGKAVSSPKDSVLPGDTIYIVRKGDTVEKIADKFRTTASSIRLVNLVDNSTISEGDKLIIPTHHG